MFRLGRLFAVMTLGLTMSFAAWGLGADVGVSPDMTAADTGAQAVFELELPPSLKPPECGLEGMDGEAEEIYKPAQECCWVYYYGRYWCVAC